MQELLNAAQAPWAFVLLYAAACVAFLPASVLTLAAGAYFGLYKGFALVSLASTLGATLAFLIGRYLARTRIQGMLAHRPKLKAVDAAVEKEGWRIVFLLRLSPVVPFNALNYALGITGVGLREYVLASWVGMLPGTLLYVWLGAAGADLARGQRTPAQWALTSLGLAATALAAWLIGRRARASLKGL